MIALKIRVLESMSQLERSHDQKDEATFVSKSVRLDLGKSRRRKGGAGRIGADCCYPSLSYSMLRCWLCCKDLSKLTKSFAISLLDQTYSACGLLDENDELTAQDGWCLDETVVCLKRDVKAHTARTMYKHRKCELYIVWKSKNYMNKKMANPWQRNRDGLKWWQYIKSRHK